MSNTISLELACASANAAGVGMILLILKTESSSGHLSASLNSWILSAGPITFKSHSHQLGIIILAFSFIPRRHIVTYNRGSLAKINILDMRLKEFQGLINV